MLLVCSFEVETDGDSIDILDVSLDKMTDEDSTEEEEDEEDEDEESVYGGPVSQRDLALKPGSHKAALGSCNREPACDSEVNKWFYMHRLKTI